MKRVLLLLRIVILVLVVTPSGQSADITASHVLTLEKVLSNGQDVALMVGVGKNSVAKVAVTIAGKPFLPCRIVKQELTLEDSRLRGSMQVLVGTNTEKFSLDASLDKEGTYSVVEGLRTVTGNVRVEAPTEASSQDWKITFESVMGHYSNLNMLLNVDRKAGTFKFVRLGGYNKEAHTADLSRVTFDGTTLSGEIAFVVKNDGWLPPDKKDLPGTMRLNASLDGHRKAGTYTAMLGVETQRSGRVVAAPRTLEEMMELTAPVLPYDAPWRAWLTLATSVARVNGVVRVMSNGNGVDYDPTKIQHSPLPPEDWVKPDFDDSTWPRYLSVDLVDHFGSVSNERGSLSPARLCLRTFFGIADPEKVKDLKLKLEYLGGAVVSVNGQEIGRGHMQKDGVPWAPAEDYPLDSLTTKDGTTPPPSQATQLPQSRVRNLSLDIPGSALVKGRNTLTIVLHRTMIAGSSTGEGLKCLGFRSAVLGSTSGQGVIVYNDALKGTRAWSAGALEQITDTPSRASLFPPYDQRSRNTAAVRGVQIGNPFESIRPIKMLAPRNGVCSGQTVLSDLDGLREVSATLGPLQGPSGATIPADAVQIRYAVQHNLLHYCDSLASTPPEHAMTIPVWLIVQAPKDAVPGWYTSELNLRANGKTFSVPVHLLVSAIAVPDARDFSSSVAIAEAPENVALEYGVPCWSDEHFRFLEPSLAMMGMVGNDAVQIPVILGRQASFAVSWVPYDKNVSSPGPSRRVPLIRWVKKGDTLEPEFSLLEKFLDAYTKHCAQPRALCLYIWDASSAKEIADVYESRRVTARVVSPKSPLLVCVWDPATGKSTDTEVPGIAGPDGIAFWKPMFEGVRAIVKKRGWPESCIVAGMGGDIRPSQKVGELLRESAPYVRWYLLSHYSGDPGPKDRKLIATGGLEIAMKEYPAGGVLSLPDMEKRILEPFEFLELPTFREHEDRMTPFMFRMVPMKWGAVGRAALDFWPGRGGMSCNSWFSHTERMTMPGPSGAIPTIRFQMFREGIQDHELRATIIRAYTKLPEDQRQAYRTLLEEFVKRHTWGSSYLSQMEIAYDWPGYVARLHAAVAELAGTSGKMDWNHPPK